jgi:aarF domain-containing kinase
MRMNLPKEMDFVHEASNAARAAQDFENISTSLYIPTVISATKRVLIMEYIQGGRVDDLEYLAQHKIDRNKVALELARIFNQMVFINGWFHAVRSTVIIISIRSDIGCVGSTSRFLFSLRCTTNKQL